MGGETSLLTSCERAIRSSTYTSLDRVAATTIRRNVRLRLRVAAMTACRGVYK
jgi:hypothetical protein